jgi:hypothetical protein
VSRVFDLLADGPKVPAKHVPALTADRVAKKEFLFRVLRQPGTSEAQRTAISEQLRTEFKIDPAASLANREHRENARANDARAKQIQYEHDQHEAFLNRALTTRYKGA